MPSPTDPRVAVYIDFDNIVISRYDQLHGKGAWRNDNARDARPGERGELGKKLTAATVDVGAILDYASSFGTVALSRAYADWSVPANASYRSQLVDRAVDLTQLFQATKAGKNGGDIRLSVDVLEDLFRLPDLSHVVIVAGDSDYIALAQRCKRLGRFVVGIGVAGGTSPALIAACDEYEMYDAIPSGSDEAEAPPAAEVPAATVPDPGSDAADAAAEGGLSDRAASRLLVRALDLLHAKEDDEWLHAATVKSQIKRMDPSFNEKQLGFATFTDFVSSRGNLAEVKVDGNRRYVRRRPAKPEKADKGDKGDKADKADKPARSARGTRAERPAKTETPSRAERAEPESPKPDAETSKPDAETPTSDAAVATQEPPKRTRAPRRASSPRTTSE